MPLYRWTYSTCGNTFTHTHTHTHTHKSTLCPLVTNTRLFIDPVLFGIHYWHPLLTWPPHSQSIAYFQPVVGYYFLPAPQMTRNTVHYSQAAIRLANVCLGLTVCFSVSPAPSLSLSLFSKSTDINRALLNPAIFPLIQKHHSGMRSVLKRPKISLACCG